MVSGKLFIEQPLQNSDGRSLEVPQGKMKTGIPLNLDGQRWRIISVWFVCLIVNLVLILYLDFSQYRSIDAPTEAWREPINKLYLDLLAIYVPPLTTMLAIGFARKPSSSPPQGSSGPYVFAICASLLWNVIVIVQNTRLSVFHTLDIQSFASFLPILTGGLSFLVAPFLAFYFSSEKP
jgi:hypothetical protein